MNSLSLIEDCQTWIERNNKSWNSYFSKWETYAKYEETLEEEDLFREPSERGKPKNHIKKKVKQALSQKRLGTLPLKKQLQQRKNLIKKKNKSKRKRTYAKDTKLSLSSNEENLSTVIENNQLEITLKTAFSNFLKANRNNIQIFSVLFQTYSQGKVTVQRLDNLTVKPKVFPYNHFYMNLANYSFENKQTLLLPSPQVDFNIQSISPYRNTCVQSLRKTFRGNPLTAKRGYWTPRKRQASNNVNEGSFNSDLSTQQSLLPIHSAQTPPTIPRLNLEVKSCPPLTRPRFEFEKAFLKSFRLNFIDKVSSNSCQKTNKEYFKNTTISKMSLSQETKRFGDFCLHKRTNSVNLSMGNSNFSTPERKSSEQKHFRGIVSLRKHLPKKLFFENEKVDSKGDDQTELCSPLVPCQSEKLKTSEQEAVNSDSDECESIFDRVKP